MGHTAPTSATAVARAPRFPRLIDIATLLAPVAVGWAPLVWFWVENQAEFESSVMIRPAVVVAIGALVLTAVFRLLTGRLGAASLLASATLVAIFIFGIQLDILAAILGRGSRLAPTFFRIVDLVGLAVVIILVTLYARRGGRDLGRPARMIGTVALILIVLAVVRPFGVATDVSLGLDDAGGGGALAGEGNDTAPAADHAEPSHVPRTVPVLAHDDADHPDVYYIILDGYERADGLKEYFGFDDTPFIDALRQRGFFIGDQSHSNYPFTHLSLASSLNERYVPELATAARRSPSFPVIQSSLVPQKFRDRGYWYAMTRTVYGATLGSPLADAEMGAAPKFGNEYEAALVEQSLFRGLVLRPSVADYHLAAFDAIESISQDPRPTFLFAHIIAPHPPYVFDRDGHILTDTPILRGSWGGEANNKAYVEQVRYINQRVIEAIDKVLARSTTPPVIILQGDHGSWSTLFHDEGRTHQEIMTERMSILNAYYVPDTVRDLLYPSITPVNSFRALDKGLFHEPVDLLPDVSWYREPDPATPLERYTASP